MLNPLLAALVVWQTAQAPARKPDVIYVPTPQDVVDAMLDLAGVKPGDVVYDLGCGDGRFVISAAKRGARGVGVDIDPDRIEEATMNARRAGVTSRVKFITADLFETDIHEATVVTLFLLPDLNVKLRPRLLAELRPGARVVSHLFDMGGWKPDRTITASDGPVYLWTIPGKVAHVQSRTPDRAGLPRRPGGARPSSFRPARAAGAIAGIMLAR
ncbi:MAG: class I SAM-dependent methyltransferase [Acidobacteria bacterium]|nr:class I SAM-dependent methyltransferase [Acidobacteriota bacterium]